MTAGSEKPQPSPDEIRAQTERILQSKLFSRSRRQCDFLNYIVSSAIEGKEDRLKEYTIGIDVFEKDASFDPTTDSIVRVEASRLRSKLREYYDEDGPDDPIKIEIPKGHYVPLFRSLNPVSEPSTARKKSLPKNGTAIAIVAMLGITLSIWLVRSMPGPSGESRKSTIQQAVTRAEDLEKSIGVLPFANRSAIPGDAYFVDGFHDDVLTQLSKLSLFSKVISRTTMEQYRETSMPLSTIGEELGVAILLEGGVQRSGDRIRINVQLIDAAADRHIWSEMYDRELTGTTIFALQSEIARAIADALHATLSAEDRITLDSVPTVGLHAYELYQQAQQIRRTLGLGTRPEVALLLEESISEDPDFAIAHTSLARAYIDRYFTGERDVSHRNRARTALDKAFALSPGMPEVHIALADYYYKGFLDYDRALEQLDYAIPLAPGNSEAYAIRAFIKRRSGDIQGSVPDLTRAIELDPGNFSTHYVLANTYVMLRRFDESISLYDRSIELAPRNFGLRILRAYALTSIDSASSSLPELTTNPAFMDGSSSLEVLYRWEVAMSGRDYDLAMSVIDNHDSDPVIRQNAFLPLSLLRALTEVAVGEPTDAVGHLQEARTTLEAARLSIPNDPRVHSALGFAYAGLGLRDAAIESADEATELYPVSIDAVDGSMYVLNYAITHALLGEPELATAKLDQLLSAPSPWYATLNVIERSPIFDPIRRDDTYRQLVEKHRIP